MIRQPAINTIEPAFGLYTSVYLSTRKLGSGAKPFIITALSPRYVTLFHIPTLQVHRVTRKEWGRLAAKREEKNEERLLEQLHTSMRTHTLKGLRWNAGYVNRAIDAIGGQVL